MPLDRFCVFIFWFVKVLIILGLNCLFLLSSAFAFILKMCSCFFLFSALCSLLLTNTSPFIYDSFSHSDFSQLLGLFFISISLICFFSISIIWFNFVLFLCLETFDSWLTYFKNYKYNKKKILQLQYLTYEKKNFYRICVNISAFGWTSTCFSTGGQPSITQTF